MTAPMAMRGPQTAHRAWESLGNGALFTHRIRKAVVHDLATQLSSRPLSTQLSTFHMTRQIRSVFMNCNVQSFRPIDVLAKLAISTQYLQCRAFHDSPGEKEKWRAHTAQAQGVKELSYRGEVRSSTDPADAEEDETQVFKKTEKAAQASQVNFSAKLSSHGADGEGKTGGGRHEVFRLLKIARPELRTLSVAFILLVISSGVTMTIPFSIGKILDAATQEAGTLFGFKMTTFYMILSGLLVTGSCANYGRIVLLRTVGERVVSKLRSSLYRRTFVQNAEFFDANRVGDLISRLGSDTIIVGKSITQNASDGLRSLVSATVGLSMMAYVSVKLTGVLAIAFPPIALGAFLYGRAIRNLSRRIQKNLGTLSKIAEERLGNVRTSQAFAGELQEVHRYNNQVRKIFNLGRKEAFISAAFFSSSGFMGNATFVGLLFVGSDMVRSGVITVGDLTTFLMYTGYAGSSLFGLSNFYSELMKGVGAASRLFELQDREPTISPTKGISVSNARGTITFQNVAFSYPTRPALPIFTDLNFTIPQGSNVAIVAPSGAGKSTVASLLMRFYTPTKGTITIAGRNINEMNAKQLRRKIGYVGQEPVLFSGTIAENIAYGKPLASRQEIVSAARQANCQFISDFPDGLETFVGARGAQLSGGQKQRIAIARALLKNPDILILDEATSALDAESETLVNQALLNMLRGDNTTISIAHRLSTIQRSDTIICISSDGKVAQMGSYNDLAADKEGAFAKLMEWQMSGSQAPGGRQNASSEHEELTEEEWMRQRMEKHDKKRGEPSEEESDRTCASDGEEEEERAESGWQGKQQHAGAGPRDGGVGVGSKR